MTQVKNFFKKQKSAVIYSAIGIIGFGLICFVILNYGQTGLFPLIK